MLKKICGILSTLIIIILAAVAAALFVPRILGYETMSVVSGSMEPGIPVGSLIYTNTKADTDTLQKGDIITYKIGEDTRVTHRIDSIDEQTGYFITKGDANDSVDAEPVSQAQVAGKVALSIPVLGYLSIYARTPLGIAAVAGIVFILILLMFLPDVFEKEKKS